MTRTLTAAALVLGTVATPVLAEQNPPFQPVQEQIVTVSRDSGFDQRGIQVVNERAREIFAQLENEDLHDEDD